MDKIRRISVMNIAVSEIRTDLKDLVQRLNTLGGYL